jgi:hypothetical protein
MTNRRHALLAVVSIVLGLAAILTCPIPILGVGFALLAALAGWLLMRASVDGWARKAAIAGMIMAACAAAVSVNVSIEAVGRYYARQRLLDADG